MAAGLVVVGFFAAGFLAGDFRAAGVFEDALAVLDAEGFAAGFLLAGCAVVLLLYSFAPATAAAVTATTAPATAADFPGLSLIMPPAFDAASLAVSLACLAVVDAVFAADFALPLMLSAISRNFALALSKVPVDFLELGIFISSSLNVEE